MRSTGAAPQKRTQNRQQKLANQLTNFNKINKTQKQLETIITNIEKIKIETIKNNKKL